MQYTYNTKGTCSRSIVMDNEENKLINVNFIGGCNGNLKGIAALCAGMDIDDIIVRLEDITCGFKPTSCPDQLAEALKAYKAGSVTRLEPITPAKQNFP